MAIPGVSFEVLAPMINPSRYLTIAWSLALASLALLFDLLTGNQILQIQHEPSVPDDIFGFPVVLSGSTLFVGALRDDDNGIDAGEVYVYDISA